MFTYNLKTTLFNVFHHHHLRLFGPRRKMTNAIARWHSNAKPVTGDVDQVYADRLEAEMQEMAIKLHQVGRHTLKH